MASKKELARQQVVMQSQIDNFEKSVNDVVEARLGLSAKNITMCDTVAYKAMLTSKDLILCANRFKWENLPINLTSLELEAMFYQWGSLCFFENDEGNLIVSRYSKIGQLTPYGKLEKIQPIDLAGKTYDVERSVISLSGGEPVGDKKVAIIINDYTYFQQQDFEPSRASINLKSTINDQINVYLQLDNNVRLSAKKALALCENEEQKRLILQQATQILDPSRPIVAVSKNKNSDRTADLDMEMWNFDNNFNPQNHCQLIDFYDKVRRQFNGVPSPDTFEKKERKITAEAENTNAHVDMVLFDGLYNRQYGLELLQEYTNIVGIETTTVDITDCLKPTEIEPEEDLENEL